jgi:hypothetical protein
MMMPFNRTCREVAALRMHMVICDACPRFEHQMLAMRNSMRRWRNYTEVDDSVQDGAQTK